MARRRHIETSARPIHRTLTTPGVYLTRMFLFLALVSFVAAILSPQLTTTFKANPALNGLIGLVLLFGVLFAFRQVLRLYPEVRWVNAFRIADPGLAIEHKPVLLAPMATMLRDRTGALMLSTTSMRSIMDSIASRLDEARDIGRYLVALLVFLGLLGTFWGLLDTMQSVGQTIAALDTKANESALVFEELKAGLAAPLRGMGTAFSSSLLGLSGSLVIGFLELQASQAHNRFYNELEEWLSGITELTPAGVAGSDQMNHQLYNAMFEVQRSMSELHDRLGSSGGGTASGNDSVRDLAQGVNQLVSQMRQEQNIVRQWVDEQAAQSQEVASVLKDIATKIQRRSA